MKFPRLLTDLLAVVLLVAALFLATGTLPAWAGSGDATDSGDAGGTAAGAVAELPVLLEENFENGADRWQPFDPTGWRVEKLDDGKSVYNQFVVESNYKPPHRSPFNIALAKDIVVSDFVLDARVRSTAKDYAHRDCCLVFGHQDPAHMYYVHFGLESSDHSNQVFIVNDAPRVKISTKTSEGTPWTDEWHQLRVVRTTADGKIRIYFDDMETPQIEAEDKTFLWGRVGIGTFDDTSLWDNVTLRGIVHKPEESAQTQEPAAPGQGPTK